MNCDFNMISIINLIMIISIYKSQKGPKGLIFIAAGRDRRNTATNNDAVISCEETPRATSLHRTANASSYDDGNKTVAASNSQLSSLNSQLTEASLHRTAMCYSQTPFPHQNGDVLQRAYTIFVNTVPHVRDAMHCVSTQNRRQSES
jgi:hypothetical protein